MRAMGVLRNGRRLDVTSRAFLAEGGTCLFVLHWLSVFHAASCHLIALDYTSWQLSQWEISDSIQGADVPCLLCLCKCEDPWS